LQRQYHFISGLPRSGSTLLATLLRQNSSFHAAMTSPAAALLKSIQQVMHPNNEQSVYLDAKKRQFLLKSLFENYYADKFDKKIIFDTNRSWCADLSLLHELYPEAKIICCVRNPAWIMDSFEQQLLKHPFEISGMYNNDSERGTIYTRLEALAKYDRIFGFAWTSLKEAYYGNFADKLLLVDYDLLAQAPDKTLKLIYQFIQEPYYENHDFDNVDYQSQEFDQHLGMPSMHTIKGKVELRPRKTLLPPDLFERFSQLAFWHDSTQTNAHVIAVKPISDVNAKNVYSQK
jgi:sulfotransferase